MQSRRTPALKDEAVISVLIFCFLLVECAGEPGLYLQLYSTDQEKVVKEFRVEKGDAFYLDYTHSSEKTPIHDVFVIDEKGNIVLIEERYNWYAVGLESNSEYKEARIIFDGKVTRVLLNRSFPVFSLRVGWVADQVITCGEEECRLKELTDGGDLLQISVVRK
ncbi:hypothetical protein ES705_20776 [subsurface metagenome]